MLNTPSAPTKSKISVKDLNFYYGKFHALKGINLDIPENRVTAFIGPSGCGKSTLLRVLNRMFELYPEQRAEGQDRDALATPAQFPLAERQRGHLGLHLDATQRAAVAAWWMPATFASPCSAPWTSSATSSTA